MDQDRRTFLGQTGKLLVLTASAAIAWEHVLAGRPEEAPNYKATDHWWGMAVDIETVHRLRHLRAGVQDRERRAARAVHVPHLGRALRRRSG